MTKKECQPGLFCRLTDNEQQEGYSYIGALHGLYLFETRDDKQELFGRSTSAPACWHLKRGSYCYEFVRMHEKGT